MQNKQISDMELNDLQISGYPHLVFTDEILNDLEKKNAISHQLFFSPTLF